MNSDRISLQTLFVVILMALVLGLTNCAGGGGGSSSDGSNTDDSDSNDGDTSTTTEYSQIVGPEGATVEDPAGASIIIPAGALTEYTELTITTYKDSNALNSTYGLKPFIGGAEFGPDGTAFLKPVTIIIPSSIKLVPDQEYAVFTYNTASSGWEVAASGTAGPDGDSITAEVTHFTPYMGSLFSIDTLTKFEDFFTGNAQNTNAALGSYIAWFLSTTGIYQYTTDLDDETWEVVGINFHVVTKVNDIEVSEASLYGRATEGAHTVLQYSYDDTNTNGQQVVIELMVSLQWDVTEKEPENKLRVSILEPLPGPVIDELVTIQALANGGTEEAPIESVDFYSNGSLLGTDTVAPFVYLWDTAALPSGQYTLHAVVRNKLSETVESENVVVYKGGPEVLSTDPVYGDTDVNINSQIAITFSKAMNKVETEAAFSISPAITGTYSWDTESVTLTFDPDDNLENGTTYTVSISETAQSEDGQTLEGEFNTMFTVCSDCSPYVESISRLFVVMNSDPQNTLSIIWESAQDDITLPESLQYRLYRSLSPNIETLEDMTTGNGELIADWYSNADSVAAGHYVYTDSGLLPITTIPLSGMWQETSSHIKWNQVPRVTPMPRLM